MRARTWCASRDVASTCASPRCTGGSGAGTAGQDEGKVVVGALCAVGLTFVKWGEGTTDEAPWEQHQPRGSPTSWQAEVPGFPPGPRPATAQRGDTESAGRGGGPPRHCCAWTCTASSSLQVPARSGCRKKLAPQSSCQGDAREGGAQATEAGRMAAGGEGRGSQGHMVGRALGQACQRCGVCIALPGLSAVCPRCPWNLACLLLYTVCSGFRAVHGAPLYLAWAWCPMCPWYL